MTKVIGLTGGIGSGKSMVAAKLRALGIPVYMADDEAKKLLEDPDIIEKICTALDSDILTGGKVDRRKIASIVFAEPQRLEKLNAIIHPAVRAHFHRWLSEHRDFDMVAKEAAILFESGADQDCDVVISVIAPLEQRIDRVMRRDRVTRGEVELRIKNQLTDEQRIDRSTYVIRNPDGNNVDAQLEEILKKISES